MKNLAALRDILRVFLVTVSAIVIAGCASAATIPPQPFESFERAVATLKTSADEALAVEQQIVYERYLAQWVEESDVLQLQMEVDPLDPFNLTIRDESLYRDIQVSRSKLRELNSLVQDYAATLSLLSGSTEESPRVDADAVATNLKTNAEAVARSLELEVDIPDGLFFGFGQAARNLVENKRQELLIRLINESQAEIELFAQAGQSIAKLSAFGINTEYQTSFSGLTTGVDELSESKRKKLIESLLTLNEETLRQIETLKMVHDAYQALPEAHRDLARAVEEGRSLSFTELLAVAESLKQRYDEFTED